MGIGGEEKAGAIGVVREPLDPKRTNLYLGGRPCRFGMRASGKPDRSPDPTWRSQANDRDVVKLGKA